MTNPASIYKKSSLDSKILGETPHGLVRLLFQKLIEKLSESKELMLNKAGVDNAIETSIKIANALQVSTSIVQALSDSLVKTEDDLYDQLSYLYAHIQYQILLANINFEPEHVIQALKISKELSEAWESIPSEFHDMTSKK